MDATQSAKDLKLLEALKNQDQETALWGILEKMEPKAKKVASDMGFQDPENVAMDALVGALGDAPKFNLGDKPSPYNYLLTVVINRIKKQAKSPEEHKVAPPAGWDYFRPAHKDFHTLLRSVVGDIPSSEAGDKELGWREYEAKDAIGEPESLAERAKKECLADFVKFTPSWDETPDRAYLEVITKINSIKSDVARQRMVKYLQGHSLETIAKREPPNSQTGKPITKNAVYNSIEKDLKAWGWDKEWVKHNLISWLYDTLVDIQRTIQPRLPDHLIRRVYGTPDHDDPSAPDINPLHRYYDQLHKQVTTDSRTMAYFEDLSTEDMEALCKVIGFRG